MSNVKISAMTFNNSPNTGDLLPMVDGAGDNVATDFLHFMSCIALLQYAINSLTADEVNSSLMITWDGNTSLPYNLSTGDVAQCRNTEAVTLNHTTPHSADLTQQIIRVTTDGSGLPNLIDIPNITPDAFGVGDPQNCGRVVVIEVAVLTNPADTVIITVAGSSTFNGETLVDGGGVPSAYVAGTGVVLSEVGGATAFIGTYTGFEWAPYLTSFQDQATYAINPNGCEIDAPLNLKNQTDDTGAQVATLTNAPTAGNPAIWLKVKINNTDYAIPAWSA